jgi:hypothetical protein
VSRRAEDIARRDLERHAARLAHEVDQQARAGGSRLPALASLAESRRVPLSDVLAAANRAELRSIVEMPDRRAAVARALARRAEFEAWRRSWTP